MNVLKNSRGDADYIEVAISMIISIVLGMFVMFGFITLINNTVIPGMQKSFASEPGTTVSPAVFNVRTDQPPVIQLPDRSQLADIKAFYFEGMAQRAVINSSTNNIIITVPSATNVSSMIPFFVISDKATVKTGDTTPQSGTSTQNFTTNQIYTVTSESGRKVEWKITVVKGVV